MGDRSSSSLQSSESSNVKYESTEKPSTYDPLSSAADLLSSSSYNTDVYNITSGPENITLANQSAYSVIYEKETNSLVDDDSSVNTQRYNLH